MSDLLLALIERIGALEKRLSVMNVPGKITDVDATKGLYRQVIGKDPNGQDVKSPWIPYSQVAGAMKAHIPPSVGQQMVMLSNGSVENAVGVPLSWSDANPQPNTQGDENTITFRGVRVDLTNGLKVTIGGAVYDFTGTSLKITNGGTTYEFSAAGETQTSGFKKHDGLNVGKDHVHDGIVPGTANTGFPQP